MPRGGRPLECDHRGLGEQPLHRGRRPSLVVDRGERRAEHAVGQQGRHRPAARAHLPASVRGRGRRGRRGLRGLVEQHRGAAEPLEQVEGGEVGVTADRPGDVGADVRLERGVHDLAGPVVGEAGDRTLPGVRQGGQVGVAVPEQDGLALPGDGVDPLAPLLLQGGERAAAALAAVEVPFGVLPGRTSRGRLAPSVAVLVRTRSPSAGRGPPGRARAPRRCGTPRPARRPGGRRRTPPGPAGPGRARRCGIGSGAGQRHHDGDAERLADLVRHLLVGVGGIPDHVRADDAQAGSGRAAQDDADAARTRGVRPVGEAGAARGDLEGQREGLARGEAVRQLHGLEQAADGLVQALLGPGGHRLAGRHDAALQPQLDPAARRQRLVARLQVGADRQRRPGVSAAGATAVRRSAGSTADAGGAVTGTASTPSRAAAPAAAAHRRRPRPVTPSPPAALPPRARCGAR